MSKLKIAELTGAALDYAVTKAVHGNALFLKNPMMSKVPYIFVTTGDGRELRVSYSTNWAHCGPLVDQFKIDIDQITEDYVIASIFKPYGDLTVDYNGPTALIAICRAVVAAKFGDEVEIPDELLGSESHAS